MTDLLTLNQVLTLSGSVLAVNVVTNGLGYAFGLPRKYVALIVSFLLTIVILFIQNKTSSAEEWLLAFLNSFLIYVSSVGLSTVTSSIKDSTQNGGEEIIIKSRKFWDSWY